MEPATHGLPAVPQAKSWVAVNHGHDTAIDGDHGTEARRHFIVSITFCSDACSSGWTFSATARSRAYDTGWFLSITTPTGCAFSVLS